jgi:hypothetical protein
MPLSRTLACSFEWSDWARPFDSPPFTQQRWEHEIQNVHYRDDFIRYAGDRGSPICAAHSIQDLTHGTFDGYQSCLNFGAGNLNMQGC